MGIIWLYLLIVLLVVILIGVIIAYKYVNKKNSDLDPSSGSINCSSDISL